MQRHKEGGRNKECRRHRRAWFCFLSYFMFVVTVCVPREDPREDPREKQVSNDTKNTCDCECETT